MAVYLGVLMPTEHVFYQRVQEAMGSDSAWTHLHRQALGLEPDCSPTARGQAAACLYEETACLLLPVLDSDQRRIVEEACTHSRSSLLS